MMQPRIARSFAPLVALLLLSAAARAEPKVRYGAAFALGAEQIAGDAFEAFELTLQASLRVAPGWRVAAHLHNLRLSSDALPGQTGLGLRSGLGLERTLASYTEKKSGAVTASVRAGVTRDVVLWDRGRLDRSGVYLELRGLVDFATTPARVERTRWFGLGLSVRGYAMKTPALCATIDGAALPPGAPTAPRLDYGFLVSWEWTASR